MKLRTTPDVPNRASPRGLILSPQPYGVQAFFLDRHVDVSGKSGTGAVAWGVRFPSGQCGLIWNGTSRTFAIYPDDTMLKNIHGHDGNTEIVWLPRLEEYPFSRPRSGEYPETPPQGQVKLLLVTQSVPMVNGGRVPVRRQAGMLWDSGELAMEWYGANRSIVHYANMDAWRSLHEAADISMFASGPLEAKTAASMENALRLRLHALRTEEPSKASQWLLRMKLRRQDPEE